VSGVLKYLLQLLERDTGEPFHELGERSTVFQVFEQRRHGHARATEHPRATENARSRFDRRTGGPINHEEMLSLTARLLSIRWG
jgi:hypothetical protein